MKRIVVLGIASALLVGGTTGIASAAESEPTRVLVVGDSVTQGRDGDYTWRYFSWKGLEQTGADVDFVGSRQGTYVNGDTWGGSYADPTFDTDHASRWGLSMWETQYASSETAPTVTELMAHDPDVIVETLGVNDFGYFKLTADSMAEQVRRFVAEARAVKPDVDVVLGSIPQTWIREVPAYNALLPDLAAELSTDESRIVATPAADFTNGIDTYDNAHPTTEGQRKIAASASVALAELGIGQPVTMPLPASPGPNDPAQPEPEPEAQPEPEVIAPPAEVVLPTEVVEVEPPTETAPAEVVPEAAPEVTVPGEPRKVRAVHKAVQTRVVWRAARDADRYVVKCGTSRKTVDGRRVALRSQASKCKVRAVNEVGASRWVKVRVR